MKNISQSELEALLGAVNLRSGFGPRDHAMIRLLVNTGLRLAEMVGLNVSHVACQGQPRQVLYLPGELAKGGRARTIPLNQGARQAVSELLAFLAARGFSSEPEAPLLVVRQHRRISLRLVQQIVQELRQKANLATPVTAHSCRHYAAYRIMPSWCGGLACISVSIEFGGLTTRHNPGVLSVRPYGRERESIRVDNRLLHAPRDHRAHAYGPSGSVHR